MISSYLASILVFASLCTCFQVVATSPLLGFDGARIDVPLTETGVVKLLADTGFQIFGFFAASSKGAQTLQRVDIVSSDGATFKVQAGNDFVGALSLEVDGETIETSLYSHLMFEFEDIDLSLGFEREHYTGQEAIIAATPNFKLCLTAVPSAEPALTIEIRVPQRVRSQEADGLLATSLTVVAGDAATDKGYLEASYGDHHLLNTFVDALTHSVDSTLTGSSLIGRRNSILLEEGHINEEEEDPFSYRPLRKKAPTSNRKLWR